MKKIFTYSFLLLSFLFVTHETKGQNNFFTDVKESSFQTAGQNRVIIPDKYRTLSLDTTALLNFLKTVPSGNNIKDHNSAPVIAIPLSNGKITYFHIWESSIMEPALAAKFPNIKTYTGQGIDDRTATIKIDWTDFGFHAMILSPVTTTVSIDPYSRGNKIDYISYFKSNYKKKMAFAEDELINNSSVISRPASPNNVLAAQCVGGQLRTYRLAITCTAEYAQTVCSPSTPTVALTRSAIVTTVNRIDGIYEKELDIHLVLVGNEDAIIFTDPATDPYPTNADLGTLVNLGQNTITSIIGEANYDIGHTFSTVPGGGTASANGGIVCVDHSKALSATGLANPTGDVYDVDYVAHEIGHEFSAHHPFNSSLGFCGVSGQQSNTTNDEPGSGSTIMAYAEGTAPGASGSLCGTDNLQVHSDPYFNTVNFNEIELYTMFGSSCATITNTGNNAPVVNAITDYTIPKSTPFVLTGSATDPDGDPLTYCWEQVNVGGSFGAWNQPKDSAPIFRSFQPVTSPTRYFPKLSDVINNTTTIGEILPTYARIMRFRLTARDNRGDGGGVCSSDNAVTVDAASGPFIVTYPDATGIKWKVGDAPTVTWNTAGTQASPVNCSNVTIQLSTDGGLTYPVTLLASTPNTGSAQISVPNNVTTTARIRVMAVGNIFYDISNNNFTIQDSTVPLTWLGFTATQQSNNTSLLVWKVNEHNTTRYEVERSIDGVNFKQLSQVPSPTGNASNQQYSYTDNSPFLGTDYYRIKEIFTDGSFDYSITIPVTFTTISSDWTIFPNPSTGGNINIQSNGNATNVAVQLFDAAGKLMYENSFSQTTTAQVINITFNRFAKGVYTLKINSSTGLTKQKILVE